MPHCARQPLAAKSEETRRKTSEVAFGWMDLSGGSSNESSRSNSLSNSPATQRKRSTARQRRLLVAALASSDSDDRRTICRSGAAIEFDDSGPIFVALVDRVARPPENLSAHMWIDLKAGQLVQVRTFARSIFYFRVLLTAFQSHQKTRRYHIGGAGDRRTEPALLVCADVRTAGVSGRRRRRRHERRSVDCT